MILMTMVSCIASLSMARLYLVNPQSLVEKYADGEITARMTNSGWLPMGTTKMG